MHISHSLHSRGRRHRDVGTQAEHRFLQLTQMILKVKDTSVMLREGGTPGGSNLGSSSVMVASRPTGPRSLTVTPIGSSQHLRCCETEVILHDPGCLKMVPGPTPRDLSGTINGSLGSLNQSSVIQLVFKLPRRRSITPVGPGRQPLPQALPSRLRLTLRLKRCTLHSAEGAPVE